MNDSYQSEISISQKFPYKYVGFGIPALLSIHGVVTFSNCVFANTSVEIIKLRPQIVKKILSRLYIFVMLEDAHVSPA